MNDLLKLPSTLTSAEQIHCFIKFAYRSMASPYDPHTVGGLKQSPISSRHKTRRGRNMALPMLDREEQLGENGERRVGKDRLNGK